MKSKYPQFKLSLALLKKEPLKLSGKLPPEFLELEPDGMIESISDIDYKLEAQMISGKVLVKGGFELSLGGSCGRCLEAVTIDLPIDFELFYDEISENDEELDITDDLRAEILLELPTNILCSEDCKGLCPHCGINLNESTCNCGEAPAAIPSLSGDDSPWSALDQLNNK